MFWSRVPGTTGRGIGSTPGCLGNIGRGTGRVVRLTAATRFNGGPFLAARFAAERGFTILLPGFLTGFFRLVVRLVGRGITSLSQSLNNTRHRESDDGLGMSDNLSFVTMYLRHQGSLMSMFAVRR